MKCELCPLQNHCPVLREHIRDSYAPEPTHIGQASDCPLWQLAIEGRNPRTKRFLADKIPADE